MPVGLRTDRAPLNSEPMAQSPLFFMCFPFSSFPFRSSSFPFSSFVFECSFATPSAAHVSVFLFTFHHPRPRFCLPSPAAPANMPTTCPLRRYRRHHSLAMHLCPHTTPPSPFTFVLPRLYLAVLSMPPISASPSLHSSRALNTFEALKMSTLTVFVDISVSHCILFYIFSLLSSLTLPSPTFPCFRYHRALAPSFTHSSRYSSGPLTLGDLSSTFLTIAMWTCHQHTFSAFIVRTLFPSQFTLPCFVLRTCPQTHKYTCTSLV